jgi:hypothetical protein
LRDLQYAKLLVDDPCSRFELFGERPDPKVIDSSNKDSWDDVLRNVTWLGSSSVVWCCDYTRTINEVAIGRWQPGTYYSMRTWPSNRRMAMKTSLVTHVVKTKAGQTPWSGIRLADNHHALSHRRLAHSLQCEGNTLPCLSPSDISPKESPLNQLRLILKRNLRTLPLALHTSDHRRLIVSIGIGPEEDSFAGVETSTIQNSVDHGANVRNRPYFSH